MLSINDIFQSKGKRKLIALTAYDYPTAKILDEAGVDILLVGDSLGMVVLGFSTTRDVTMEDMIRHGAAVVRGAKSTFVVVDMPVNSTNTFDMALLNCKKILDETHAQSVKIEGQVDIIARLVQSGIYVMGHTGLKPQTAAKYGVRGRDSVEADLLFQEALDLEKAGVFALVLECVPVFLAEKITKALKIPVIGIGAGNSCDGQILVSSDMIGLYTDFKPVFVRRYGKVAEEIQTSVRQFQSDVKNGTFPSTKESFL